MKFYFGNYTRDHADLGIDTSDLFYNAYNNTYYFYLLEFTENGEVTLSDSIGRAVPFDSQDIKGLLLAAKLADKYYTGTEANAMIYEHNNNKLLDEMAELVRSAGGGSSDVS